MSQHQPIFLHVFWHQHQPWYIGPDSNIAWMPWVRMHGVKDYYDMAWLCQRFDGWKQTINLVPSLLEQLSGLCSGEYSDTALELTRKPAADLTRDEKRLIIERFFDAHAPRMVDPYTRYAELNQKRSGGVEEAIDRYSTQDYLDLQVWFNLTWLDPIWKEDPDEIAPALINKGRNFTEDDKSQLLDLHFKILRQIIPIHRRLTENGGLETTTTPHFHPILPLLCDSDIARISNPFDPVPSPAFQSPEDAKRHIQSGLNYFERVMGFRPKGMWPSEGSVSDQACALMAGEGVNYFATDEAVLFRSSPANGDKLTRDDLFRLHRLETPNGELDCIFRDHGLSDMIGFVNQTQDGKQAAKNLIKQLHNIGSNWNRPEPPLINIILDGENCWEYYPRDGHDFLQYFIEGVLKDSRIIPTTVPDYREIYPAETTLNSIFPGSWINQNFRIWIGHEEDNLAWSLIRDARAELVQKEPSLNEDVKRAAWRQIDICEGSDWFWWYGDENQTSLDFIFDQLFRSHLAHLYQLLELDPPNELRHPIKKGHHLVHSGGGGVMRQAPNIDAPGGYFQWAGARYAPASSGGAMHQADAGDGEIWYGRHQSSLCIRCDFNSDKPLHEGSKLYLKMSQPVEIKILLNGPNDAIQLNVRDRRLQAIVDLTNWEIESKREIWFCLVVEQDGKLDASIPQDGELQIQGVDNPNDSLVWYL